MSAANCRVCEIKDKGEIDMKILFIDTETGGLNAEKHSLLTVAFAVYNNGEIVAEKEFAVKHKYYLVSTKALEVNNINLIEHDQIAIESKVVVQEIIKFIKDNFGDEKPVIAGHNIEFDYKFLDKLFQNEKEYWWKYVSHRKLDTCSLINFLMVTGKIEIESASLEASINYFKIETNARHTAKDDVRATIALFENINKLFN
jgi:DNA polymerase III epsilon subunit-like protein|nr:MAG TPA: Oligoribonuclease [Caudoviricetes sp.]